jgi:catechol 2,3-dioxygenase-like lactoylglutathione lyase family enzyme
MAKPPDLAQAHLRIARLSADLAAAVKFYGNGLGFEVLYEFKDHDGFGAVMLGRNGAAYHLAFVHKAGHQVAPAPTHDDLLVFYLPDADDWNSAVTRLKELERAAGAIGMTTATVVEQSRGKVKLLSLNGVIPSAENVERKIYTLTRDSFLVTKAPAPPAVSRFIEFIRSPAGAAAIVANSAVPVK